MLILVAIVQSLHLVVFAWFHRVAGLRIIALRQQLAIYMRMAKKPILGNRDRLFWPLLSRVWKDWASELIFVNPETVIRWRMRKFREFWRKKSQNRPGRPAIFHEHIAFIRRISSDHPEYGEDRIALELEVKFGIHREMGEYRSPCRAGTRERILLEQGASTGCRGCFGFSRTTTRPCHLPLDHRGTRGADLGRR